MNAIRWIIFALVIAILNAPAWLGWTVQQSARALLLVCLLSLVLLVIYIWRTDK